MIHSTVTGQVGNGVSAVPIWMPSPPSCPARHRMQSLPCRDARAGFPGTGACPWHYRAFLTWFPSHGLMLTDDHPLEAFCTYHGRQLPAQIPPSIATCAVLPSFQCSLHVLQPSPALSLQCPVLDHTHCRLTAVRCSTWAEPTSTNGTVPHTFPWMIDHHQDFREERW